MKLCNTGTQIIIPRIAIVGISDAVSAVVKHLQSLSVNISTPGEVAQVGSQGYIAMCTDSLSNPTLNPIRK